MQAHFEKQQGFTYTLKLDSPYSNEELVEEFEKEQWIATQAGYGQSSFSTRFQLHNVTQPKLSEIEQYIEHGTFKKQIIDTLWATSFPGLWGVSADRMDSMTFIYGIFTKDLPGFNIGIHTDDRMHVLQGMIYFINGDDPRQSTILYSNKQGNDPYHVPTGHGVGYFASNTNHSWHSGQNASDQDRYSMIFGIRLNL
jgi:hypothetical protein